MLQAQHHGRPVLAERHTSSSNLPPVGQGLRGEGHRPKQPSSRGPPKRGSPSGTLTVGTEDRRLAEGTLYIFPTCFSLLTEGSSRPLRNYSPAEKNKLLVSGDLPSLEEFKQKPKRPLRVVIPTQTKSFQALWMVHLRLSLQGPPGPVCAHPGSRKQPAIPASLTLTNSKQFWSCGLSSLAWTESSGS